MCEYVINFSMRVLSLPENECKTLEPELFVMLLMNDDGGGKLSLTTTAKKWARPVARPRDFRSDV